MELKVYTLKTCPNCPEAKRIAQEVAEKFSIKCLEIDIGTPKGQIEGLMHQIMSTPTITLDNEVLVRGKIVPKKELEYEIRKRLKK